MKRIFIYFLSCLTISCVFYWSACIKKDFDAPPDKSNYDPGLPVTQTIEELKKMSQGVALTQNIVIEGTVVMSDKSGNYFNKIVIEDATAGIAIEIDQNNLYNDYPVGRKIYVKCKGLFLGVQHQNLELGYTPDNNGILSSIPSTLLNQFIVKANFPNPYSVDTLTIAQLSSPNAASRYLNKVVAIRNVEFAVGSAGVPYAQKASIASSTDLGVEDCDGATITLTSSGYAKFQPYLTPTGKGTLTGLYTRYNNIAQIFIRDTDDIQFNNPRCNGSTPEPPARISVDSLRNLFKGTDITLPPLRINGIVISDGVDGNVTGGTIVLQGGNEDRGIVLYYGSLPNYNLGDSLSVDITSCILKQSLTGSLTIEGVRTDKTTSLGVQKSITPHSVTIAEILTHKNQYESTLVRLSNINWQSGAINYFGDNGNVGISDGTGTITHYCANTSSFKNLPLPNNPTSSVIGYMEVHGLYGQIRIRYPNAPVNDVNP